jgi:hypothetical protein
LIEIYSIASTKISPASVPSKVQVAVAGVFISQKVL